MFASLLPVRLDRIYVFFQFQITYMYNRVISYDFISLELINTMLPKLTYDIYFS